MGELNTNRRRILLHLSSSSYFLYSVYYSTWYQPKRFSGCRLEIFFHRRSVVRWRFFPSGFSLAFTAGSTLLVSLPIDTVGLHQQSTSSLQIYLDLLLLQQGSSPVPSPQGPLSTPKVVLGFRYPVGPSSPLPQQGLFRQFFLQVLSSSARSTQEVTLSLVAAYPLHRPLALSSSHLVVHSLSTMGPTLLLFSQLLPLPPKTCIFWIFRLDLLHLGLDLLPLASLGVALALFCHWIGVSYLSSAVGPPLDFPLATGTTCVTRFLPRSVVLGFHLPRIP